MAQTKIERIASIEEEIKQLKERQKLLQQQHNAQERKDRTKRLCKRMGLFESLLPDTIALTDEQFKSFLEKTMLTEFTRRMLAEIQTESINPILSKPAGTVQDSGGEWEQDGGNGARVTG